MKKIVSLILIVVLSLSAMTACNRSYDEEEVSLAARELIEKSVMLNEIFWGEGIPYIKNPSTANGAYYEADFLLMGDWDFTTVDELKEITRAVFSTLYCESIFSTVFSSISDSEEIQFFARYYQKYADADGKIPECIMVYSYAENLLPDDVEYLYDTIKVTHSEKDRVFVTIEANVTREDKTQRRTKEIALVEEANGWRLDSSTYLKYSENFDEYEDLINKK